MRPLSGNIFHLDDLVRHYFEIAGRQCVMDNRINDDSEPIDHKTSRSIREAVAQRLKENLRLEPSRLSSHLSYLVEELRRRENGGTKSNQR
jgi:hypothetical protein